MGNLEKILTREVNLGVDLKFFKTLKENLKIPTREEPITFIEAPRPRRYSFKSRPSSRVATTRPSSSSEAKCRSLS